MEVSAFNIIATILLMLILISVAATIVIFIGTEAKQEIPAQVQNTVERFVNVFFAKAPYNLCEALSEKEISLSDFQTLLQAVYNGQCGSSRANVTLSFSLAKEDIQKIARVGALANGGKLIYYNLSSPLGVGGIIIQGQPGYYPLKKWDTVEIWQEGEPQPDVLIKLTIKGCDPYDDICDPLCTYKNLCDPVCDDGQKHDITCNPACIDVNNNKTVDEEDAANRIKENKCNPDCYTNITNPFKFYDPGCIYKYHAKLAEMYDNICDPNSNGVKDGLCDPDCVKTKNLCDPDCDGEVDSGNPNGVKDEKCLVCEGECNGWCSPACEYVVDDPDCERNADPTFWCDGDQICDSDRKETCENSQDCNSICEEKNFLCCVNDKKSDFAGCTENKDLKEGDECGCDNQCENEMKCDETGHCCSEGKSWNGEECVINYKFTILFIPVQWGSSQSDFESYSDTQASFFISTFPFKDCPDSIKVIKAWDLKECGDRVSLHCSSQSCPHPTLQEIESCADTKYSGKYDRAIGLVDASLLCGGPLGWSCATMEPKPVVVAKPWSEVTTHELGHTYGLCDEYSGCVWDQQNAEIGCPNPKACDCCSGGNACCAGRSIPGGYCTMGPGGVPHPGFCSYCFDHLGSILKCS